MSLGASLSVQEVVPPAEARRVVANELLVVHVVMVGTSPDGEEVAQAPGEVVATVGVDGLEETQDDPNVHGDEVEIASDLKEENGRANNTNTEKHGLNGRGVLSSETERSRVGVVHLVNGLVERTVVQAAVKPVVPGILHDEEDGDLDGHLGQRGERNTIVHAEVSSNRVEEPDLRKLSGEMADEDNGSAIPLLLECRHLLVLDLELLEVGDLVHDDEGQAAAEVDNLVHDKAHDAGSEGIVLHEKVPSLSTKWLVRASEQASRVNAA